MKNRSVGEVELWNRALSLLHKSSAPLLQLTSMSQRRRRIASRITRNKDLAPYPVGTIIEACVFISDYDVV